MDWADIGQTIVLVIILALVTRNGKAAGKAVEVVLKRFEDRLRKRIDSTPKEIRRNDGGEDPVALADRFVRDMEKLKRGE